MKRYLVLIPIILLVVLNACGSNQAQMAIIVHQTDTAAAVATLTATNMPPTATPFPTIDPNEQQIVNLMNASGVQYKDGFDGGSFGDPMFQTKLDELEDFLGPDFIVFDVAFPPGENNMITLFQINARCECGTNRPCCTAERMFILTMRELFLNRDSVMGQVPTTVQTMQLLCFDHGRYIATISAAWQDVQSFLYGNLNGLQFGSRVTLVP